MNLLNALLATFEANRAFAAVHMARMVAADHGLDVSDAFRDHEDRAIVDSLPSVDVYEVEPETVRCYGVAA